MNDEASFDHAWRLDELLDGNVLSQIGHDLEGLLGTPCRIEDERHAPLWGDAPANSPGVALVLELDPVGWLRSAAADEALRHAAHLLQAFLRTRLSYRMAASLHQESIAEDYAELRRTNARLLASEERYRNLAAQLEVRVQEQLAELEARQQQIFLAARLASVGQLAAGVAHEINNPLGFVRSNFASLQSYLRRLGCLREGQNLSADLRRKLDLDFMLEDADQILNECLAGLDRIGSIVRDLKAFSTVDIHEQHQCDINVCLQQAAAMLEGELPAGISLDLDLTPLPPVPGIAGHLNQAFLNLLRNGMQAIVDTHHGGHIRVSSRMREHAVEICITDDGIGMSPEVMTKAFDPFFTTRPIGAGIGLGLSSARSIVLAHGGEIRLNSTPGTGTGVTLRLPLP